MKALSQITIIILLCPGLASANSSQAPSAPAASVSIQADEVVSVQPPVPSTPLVEGRSIATSIWPSPLRGAGAVLVIPSTEMKPEDIAAVIEDMTIMSRILDKNIGQERLTTTRTGVFLDRGTDPWSEVFAGRGRASQAIYLEGFGSLFFLSVDFPLSPPPKVEEEKAEEGVDTVWRDTKIAIYQPEAAKRRVKSGPQKEYDAERVQDLQKTLIKTLKHAANIRGLKTDEWVTMVIRSSAPAVVITRLSATRSSAEKPPAESDVAISSALPVAEQPDQATFLTIRAKKSDIDSFAKNQLDYDKFSQRVSVLTY